MVRTHPVTGWKTLFAGGLHCRRVDGVVESESQDLLAKILRLVSDNHDLQVRFRWNGSGDMGKSLSLPFRSVWSRNPTDYSFEQLSGITDARFTSQHKTTTASENARVGAQWALQRSLT